MVESGGRCTCGAGVPDRGSGRNGSDRASGLVFAPATVVDPLTVVITTNTPFATLVVDVVQPIATDHSKGVSDAKFKTNRVAAGAWKFVSQELNANVKYERTVATGPNVVSLGYVKGHALPQSLRPPTTRTSSSWEDANLMSDRSTRVATPSVP
jgi:ABC-type transport system substrate-binding protein